MTSSERRTFLRGTLAGSMLTVAAGAGLLRPARVLAADWPQGAFTARSVDDALKALHGSGAIQDSPDVKLEAPLQAENGAKVPLKIQTTLAGVESIDVLVKENATPLAGRVALTDAARGFFSARVKMAKTSDVYAVVKAGGKLHTAKLSIKVTVGGCGG